MAGGPENDILIEETGPDFVVRWGFSHFPRWQYFARWQHFPRRRYLQDGNLFQDGDIMIKNYFFSANKGTVHSKLRLLSL